MKPSELDGKDTPGGNGRVWPQWWTEGNCVCVCVSVWFQGFTLLMSSMSTVTYKYICSVLALLPPRSMVLEQAWIFSCSWASLSVQAEPTAAPLSRLRSAPDVQKPRGTNIAMAQTYCFENYWTTVMNRESIFPMIFLNRSLVKFLIETWLWSWLLSKDRRICY